MDRQDSCLVTGASGYIGGRLVPELLDAGHRMRCMTRSARRLRDHPWPGRVEIAEADATDPGATRRALEGIDVAYYLIHAIGGPGGFAENDRRAARVFAWAARDAGVRRLVYLGGMDPEEELSPHLRSRAEVGKIMLGGGAPAVWLRAAMIIGSGSASFEMLRYLTEPSSLWVGVVTPVPGSIARPLVESLRNEVVCTENDVAQYVPPPPGGPIGFDRSVALALRRVRAADVATRWSSAGVPGAPSDPLPTDPDWAGGSLYTDDRSCRANAPPDRLWEVVEGIGGERGWYSFPLAWRARGVLDRLVGGAGLRRGRRDPRRLRIGETVDFWRVEEIEAGRLLRLRAEMRVPGLAWLELRVSEEDGRGLLGQRALFHPRGLAGHAYWWAFRPFHDRVFGGMCRGIARAAEEAERPRAPEPHRTC
ncbi:SDR family oxidoreductase [Actinomadura sp. KC345]|uniref:SDR family oxidoreductase n=1 Tax=Actinomadura sp. KC345 TaxID=2530371 RepID=UPI001FB5D838|nr:SDR family oxidoreductase [Actinomadura sp. KC345]